MNWRHSPASRATWESWDYQGPGLACARVLRVDLANGETAYYGRPLKASDLGYYVVVNHNYHHPDVLPLDTPLDQVLAAAIVIARMSTPKEQP